MTCPSHHPRPRGDSGDTMEDRAEGSDRVAKQEDGGKVEAKQRKKESIPSLSSSSLPPLTYSLIEEAKLTIAR